MITDRTPVNVIGPGAVGIGIAVLLARSGKNVALLGREGPIPTARLRYKGSELDAIFPCESVFDGAFTLITSKAYDLDAVLSNYHTPISSSTCVLYLQNGLGLPEKFSGFSNAVQGILWVSAERLDRNYANWITGLRIVLDGKNSLGRSTGPVLGEAGIATVFADDFQIEIFKKLMVNLACNPVSALYQIPNAEIHLHPELRRRAILAAKEIAELATRLGHRVDLDPVEIVDGMAAKLGDFKSSTLQDRDAGRQLEIEAIMLEPILAAERLGLQLPEVSALYAELKTLS